MMDGDGNIQKEANPARKLAMEVARRLRKAGFAAYFAGGCVRDRLMGNEPKDYDVATDAKPEQVLELFPHARSVGEAFGVVLLVRHGWKVEIATFRTDGVYSDGRHPDAVTYSDAEHDAQRRDFTINGLFEDPDTGEVIDYVGGRADLDAKLVRAIGDPARRLQEDQLRMLRAVRFAARFGFTIESRTAAVIRVGVGSLRGVSRERIGQEMRLMFEHPNRAVAAWEMQYLGLDEAVLCEPHRDAAPARLGRLAADATFPTCLAAWLLDRWEGEGDDAFVRTRVWNEALVLSGREYEALAEILRGWRTLTGEWSKLGVARQKRMASSDHFQESLQLVQVCDRQRFVDVCRGVEALARSGLAPEPLIRGDDLLSLGITPGPVYSRVLEAVYDAQLEGAVANREEAVSLATALARAAGEAFGS